MSDDMLSQDEIDALLKSTDDNNDEEQENNQTDTTNLLIDDYLSPIEQDTLGEIGNISFGSSATTLSALLNQKVEITTPELRMVSSNNLAGKYPKARVGVEVQYTEGFKGANLFVIQASDAAIIADLMLGGDGTSPAEELNDVHLSAVQEAMNQMMGTAATSMSTIFAKRVDISPPTITELEDAEKEESFASEEAFVNVSFQLKIGNLIDSNIMQLLPVQFAKELVDQLLNTSEPQPAVEEKQTPTANNSQPAYSMAAASDQSENGHGDGQQRQKQLSSNGRQEVQQVQKAQFSNFDTKTDQKNDQRNLDMLLDIPLKVTVELGRTKRSVKDILEFSSGSIIELDKLAGEPVDIHVNDKLIAQGEVVVIEENFGVRITDILSQSDRLKKLN